jgi:hypothetical protein
MSETVPTHRYSREEIALQLLDFIESTERYMQASQQYNLPWLAATFSSQAQEVFQSSRATINSCLQAIGGLAATLESPHGNQRIILMEWHGRDTDNPDQYQWNTPQSRVSLDVGVIEEIRQEILAQQPGLRTS